jgi:hypothetical protein
VNPSSEIPSNISLSEKVAACGKFSQFLGNSEKMPEIPTADSTARNSEKLTIAQKAI